jgi:peptidoglycan/LPS O-acetylase OafA/YrhL
MNEQRERFLYIDNLRLMMIILVVCIHLAVTYSCSGLWYIRETRPLGLVSQAIFDYFQSFTQGYFMGFLFLLAGFFVPSAYDKKGFLRFIKDRCVRLGIPTMFYVLLVHPFILYFILDLHWVRPKPELIVYYTGYVNKLNILNETGPLWFAFVLLVLSVVYAVFRVSAGAIHWKPALKIGPGCKNAVILIVLVSICTFMIRLAEPLGASVFFLQQRNAPQYLIFFLLGIAAYRNNLFSRISYVSGKRWLVAGLFPGFILWAAIMVYGGTLQGYSFYSGGVSWQSAAYALWESFVAVSMSIGLLSFFREKGNSQNRLVRAMSENSFAVYVFHSPIIVGASLLMKTVEIQPIIKWMILIAISMPVCFAFTNFIVRKIPLLNRVF